MAKCIVYTNPETGTAAIVHPASLDTARPVGETQEELLARVISRGAVPEGVEYWFIDADQVPNYDRTFRDAWECLVGTIKVNMPKARAIHMDRIRAARDRELARLDVPYLKALEAGDIALQDQIAAQKQALRDIPQTFKLSGARTPAGLEALWPAEIP